MTQPKKVRTGRKFLLKAAAALGGGSMLAACSSGPIAGLPVEDAGITVDSASHVDAGTTIYDAGLVADAGTHGITADDAGADGGGPVGDSVDAGGPQDAGEEDAGHIIVGVIVHPDGG